MTRRPIHRLTARFIAEAASDINQGLAEGVNPHHEYALLVAEWSGRGSQRMQPAPELTVGVDVEFSFDIAADLYQPKLSGLLG